MTGRAQTHKTFGLDPFFPLSLQVPLLLSLILFITLQRKIKVQDFKSYPLFFTFKDLSCLTRNTPTMQKEMSKMHEEDAHDDNLIAMEITVHMCIQDPEGSSEMHPSP